MLPIWVKNGRPVVRCLTLGPGYAAYQQTIPVLRQRITLPSVPVIVLVLVLILVGSQLRAPAWTSGPAVGDHDALTGFTTSPFRVDKSLIMTPLPLPTLDYLADPLQPKKSGMRVPNSVHYVYGLKPLKEGQTKGEELPYYAYLAMRSALLRLQPEKMYFHYDHLPTGPWWDLIEPHLTLMKTVTPTSVFGKPVNHFAHQADIIRLLAMKHMGGIYLDIDMFIVKSFDDLLYAPTTLGMEMATDSSRSPLDPEGLCNAVIISEPDAIFIDRWLASYDSFDEGPWENWAEHSVRIPWQIARRHPEDLQVMNHRAFFYPNWHGDEVQHIHERDDHDFYGSGQYAYHAWETLAMKYLSVLSPEKIREEDNSFNRLLRPLIGATDDEVYRQWRSTLHNA